MSLFQKDNVPFIIAFVVSVALITATLLMLPGTTPEQSEDNLGDAGDGGADASVAVSDGFVPAEEEVTDDESLLMVGDEMAVSSLEDEEDAAVAGE